MYKPIEPIRCPKCGTTVNVNTSMILTSNPPCYEWTCPNCGEKGYTKQGDIITFENQIGGGTSGYIQKVGEPDLSVGATPRDSVALENKVFIEATTPPPKTAACNIPAPKFIQQGWECPKCGAILAPHQSYCPFCSEKESDWIRTVGTGTQPFYSEWTNKDNLTSFTTTYSNPNQNISVKSEVK